MEKEEIFKNLFDAVVEMDTQKAKDAAELLIKEDCELLEGIEHGLSKAMKVIGDKFNNLDGVYLPELLLAAAAFNAAMDVLRPHLSSSEGESANKGTVVIGTVDGDVHKIGKDLVALLLETQGFEVHNIGENISTSVFVEEAAKVNADIIALSSLLTTTMAAQKDLVDVLKELGQRDKYLIMIGGSPCSQEWADEIGADMYGETAGIAVDLALEFMSKNKTRKEINND